MARISTLQSQYGAHFSCLTLRSPLSFDIPIPTFSALFQQHMVAPFFVFQLFCVTLWFLDDMWYYSLFTLIMLFVFEGTVVMQVRTCVGTSDHGLIH